MAREVEKQFFENGLKGIVWIGDPPEGSFPLACHGYEDAISTSIGIFEPVYT